MQKTFYGLVILVTLLAPISVFGQQLYTGTINNKANGKAIPYATIGLVKQNTGVNADENGSFSIRSVNAHDSLLISSVGFLTRTIALSSLTDIIALEEKPNTLKEVALSARKEHISLNVFSSCSYHTYHTSYKALNQLAVRFKAPEAGMQLSEVTLCKEGSKSLFRLRVYGADSLGRPSGDLADSIIEVTSSKRRVTINLSDYHIIIPDTDFFIAVEWIFIPSNSYIMRSRKNDPRISNVVYNPGIAFDPGKSDEPGMAEAWVLHFNGSWRRITYRPYHFLISPKVSR